MHFADFSATVARLHHAIKEPLPGASAQQLMAPRPGRHGPAGFNPARIRHAAGLLLVFPKANRAHIVLTVRSDTLERHGGQVSLPGGVIEPGETFEQAALREAHEEIALPTTNVRIVGALTPLDIFVSGFRLHPIVGVIDERPMLHPSDGEVARILEVPIDELVDPAHLVTVERTRGTQRVVAPAFRIGSDELWGATAMVVAELLVLLGWSPALAE